MGIFKFLNLRKKNDSSKKDTNEVIRQEPQQKPALLLRYCVKCGEMVRAIDTLCPKCGTKVVI